MQQLAKEQGTTILLVTRGNRILYCRAHHIEDGQLA